MSMTTPCEPTAEAAAAVLALGPEMTIAYAAELRETLLDAATAAAAADTDLLLDLAGVSDFDSSGVQLLLSARLSLQAHGHVLRLVACSAAVRDALRTFGLTDLLAPAPSLLKD
jgi:anti-anti-sigma factor